MSSRSSEYRLRKRREGKSCCLAHRVGSRERCGSSSSRRASARSPEGNEDPVRSSDYDSDLEAIICTNNTGTFPSGAGNTTDCDSDLEALIAAKKDAEGDETTAVPAEEHDSFGSEENISCSSVTFSSGAGNTTDCDSNLEALIATNKDAEHDSLGSEGNILCIPVTSSSGSYSTADCDSDLESVTVAGRSNPGNGVALKLAEGIDFRTSHDGSDLSNPAAPVVAVTYDLGSEEDSNDLYEDSDSLGSEPETQRFHLDLRNEDIPINFEALGHDEGGGGDGGDDGHDGDDEDDDDEDDVDGDDEDHDDEGNEDTDSSEEDIADEANHRLVINSDNEEHPSDPDDPGVPGGEVAVAVVDDDATSEEDGANFTLENLDLNLICQSVRNCTLREVTALILAIGAKHRLTYDATIGMMNCFNAIYGRKYLPVDKKVLWRLLGKREVGIRKYVYCHKCLRGHGRYRLFPEQLVCGCRTVIKKRFCKIYIDLSMEKQLQNLLRKQSIREARNNYMEQRQLRLPGTMADILDGSQYRHLREPGNVLASVHDNSFTFNLDGFRLAKSSTAEGWPIYCRWSELPPRLRHKHILLAGVWVDLQHPNMNLYLETFVNQVNHLSNVGVRWQPDGEIEEVTSKFVPTCLVVDAQARCAILNLNGPTGYCACPFCDHRGLHIGGCVHFPYHFPIPIPERRTHQEIRRCMIAAANNQNRRERHVLGFKGPSQLLLMNHFDLGKNVVTDDMHPFAGVIELHTRLLLTRTRDFVPEYYIGGSIDRIDLRLLSIRTPSHISRKPRSLKRRKKWQSSEWRNWLLYYMIPCLEGILPRKYLRHFQLLAEAVFLISKDYVSADDCNEAERLFIRYVQLFETYFGREHMTYNIHILLHVVDCVREWGPMFGQSTSFFEDWNHTLLSDVTSPNARAEQIITRFLIRNFLGNVEENEDISARVKREVKIILEQPRLRENVRVGDVTLLGKRTRRPPNEREQDLLQEQNIYAEEMTVFKRALIGNIEYRSEDYRYAGEETKSDDTHVYTWNDEFARIVTIAFLDDAEERIVVFLNVLNTNANVNRYVSRVAADGDEVLILETFDNIRSHAIFCNTPIGSVVMPISNAWELD